MICQTVLSHGLLICHTWMSVHFHVFFVHTTYTSILIFDANKLGHACGDALGNSTGCTAWVQLLSFLRSILHLSEEQKSTFQSKQ